MLGMIVQFFLINERLGLTGRFFGPVRSTRWINRLKSMVRSYNPVLGIFDLSR